MKLMGKTGKFFFAIIAYAIFMKLLYDLLVEFSPPWLKTGIAVVIGVAIASIVLSVAYMLWGYARKSHYVGPDERGNYPIQIGLFGKPKNLNLIGADHNPMAWSLWQQTNNPGIAVKREPIPVQYQIEQQQQHVYALTTGQSDVIDSVAEDL